MINKENINKALETIKVSSDLDKKILDKTIYNISPNPLSLKKVLLTIIFVFTFTISTVFAKDLIYKCLLTKTKIANNSYKQSLSIKNYVQINNNDFTCNNKTTIKNIEQSLGVNFIFNTTKYNPKVTKCDIKKNAKGNIESINLNILEFYDYQKENEDIDKEYNENFTLEEYYKWESKRKKISLSISFMTEYASKKTKREFANIDIITSTGTTEKLKGIEPTEFYAPNINTKGFYFILPSKNIPLEKEVIFVNKNILYNFSANKQVSLEELLKIINSF